MTINVNAKVMDGEFLGRVYDFYNLRTQVKLGVGAVDSPEQKALDTLNQTIAQRGQTVVFALHVLENQTDPAGLPAGTYDVYSVSFMIEHHFSWGTGPEESVENLMAALVETGLFSEADAGTATAISMGERLDQVPAA